MAHGHDDKNNSIVSIALNLAITCFISGVIIAGTFIITEPAAEAQRDKAKNDAMKELVRDAESFKPVDGKTGWYAGMKGGKVVAYVVPAQGKGYGGVIQMLAAVEPDGKTLGFKVLKHAETPGLGDKMTEPKFRNQFTGKTAKDMEVVKVPTDKNIQALTGATITSRAVTGGIRAAAEAVAAYAAGQKK
ncbi:RnfABCDGE type electron transport complex subunit G [Anaeroselena agilis]|uniref:Ion-translocating oxidoreductase complex subunit G n=1 Tax=Anaeroselena agilis TaxID=3063788 RepID=A0ABU3NZQ0_9FIRM|nr:RnfABCDGE type electron transport complex subunit G [Selenomonadales bacterium 4137-cl]